MNSSFTSISFFRIQERSGHQQIQFQNLCLGLEQLNTFRTYLGPCLMFVELLAIFFKNNEKIQKWAKCSCMYDQQVSSVKQVQLICSNFPKPVMINRSVHFLCRFSNVEGIFRLINTDVR